MLFYFLNFLLLRKIKLHDFASIKFENISKTDYKFVLKSYKTLQDTVFLILIRTSWCELGRLTESQISNIFSK